MDKVKEGKHYIAEKHNNVTVLFCDIYDFEEICSVYSPSQLIELLNEIQISFDNLCEAHKVNKIETVGKTYLACGGLQYSSSNNTQEEINDHAQRTLQLALNMIIRAESIILRNGQNLQVKIGINSGQVIAGVVGDYKPQFALVGDTVNTASRMCSNVKQPMKIRISESTYELVKNTQYLEFEQEIIWAKGKGKMITYLVYQEKQGLKNSVNKKSQVHSIKQRIYDVTKRRSSQRNTKNFYGFLKEDLIQKDNQSCLLKKGIVLDYDEEKSSLVNLKSSKLNIHQQKYSGQSSLDQSQIKEQNFVESENDVQRAINILNEQININLEDQENIVEPHYHQENKFYQFEQKKNQELPQEKQSTHKISQSLQLQNSQENILKNLYQNRKNIEEVNLDQKEQSKIRPTLKRNITLKSIHTTQLRKNQSNLEHVNLLNQQPQEIITNSNIKSIQLTQQSQKMSQNKFIQMKIESYSAVKDFDQNNYQRQQCQWQNKLASSKSFFDLTRLKKQSDSSDDQDD